MAFHEEEGIPHSWRRKTINIPGRGIVVQIHPKVMGEMIAQGLGMRMRLGMIAQEGHVHMGEE